MLPETKLFEEVQKHIGDIDGIPELEQAIADVYETIDEAKELAGNRLTVRPKMNTRRHLFASGHGDVAYTILHQTLIDARIFLQAGGRKIIGVNKDEYTTEVIKQNFKILQKKYPHAELEMYVGDFFHCMLENSFLEQCYIIYGDFEGALNHYTDNCNRLIIRRGRKNVVVGITIATGHIRENKVSGSYGYQELADFNMEEYNKLGILKLAPMSVKYIAGKLEHRDVREVRCVNHPKGHIATLLYKVA